jgi:hypothetical protein
MLDFNREWPRISTIAKAYKNIRLNMFISHLLLFRLSSWGRGKYAYYYNDHDCKVSVANPNMLVVDHGSYYDIGKC